MFRPRGGLAKVLYEKIHTDARLQAMDKDQVRNLVLNKLSI